MAKEQDNAPLDASTDERYRYIGFDVFPKNDNVFWKDDSEQAQHLARIKEAGGKFVPLSRSNSIVAARSINAWERWTLTGTSLALLLAPILPWFSFTRGNEHLAYSGFSLIPAMGQIMGYLSLGSGSLTSSFLLMIGLMILSMVFGALTLFGLYAGGERNDQNTRRLKRILNLHFLPIIGWIVFFVVIASPAELPFGVSLGLTEVESTLSIASLANSSSYGLWIPFAVLWVNAIKGNEL